MKTRNRNIHTMPLAGGQPCAPLSKEEVVPCNTQACPKAGCIDGTFAAWGDWETCTESCEGGLSWRVRSVSTSANACGKPATGIDREYHQCNNEISCNGDKDCQFSAWGEWSDCTKTCYGVRGRTRGIKTAGQGNGKSCVGDLKQTSPCNPTPDSKVPALCVVNNKHVVDCAFGAWAKYGECSAPCGGGQVERKRSIQVHGENGGTSCNGALQTLDACNVAPCDGPDPVPCQWSIWSDWGACDKCDGQRKRHRHIAQLNKNDGDRCVAKDAEETGKCKRHCHAPEYCGFGHWKDWGDCSVSCGTGKRMRRRYLFTSTAPIAAGPTTIEAKYEVLRQAATQRSDNSHLQEVGSAFVLGAVSLSVALMISKAVASRWRRQGELPLRAQTSVE